MAGPPEHCHARLTEILALDIDRIVISLQVRGVAPEIQQMHEHLFIEEILPHLPGH